MKYISTDDGSSSLFIEELNETYHSRHGALRESKYVYIQAGLEQLTPEKEVQILEVGMGTGLNVLLAAEWALLNKVQTHLTTLEPFPIPANLIKQLNYASLLNEEKSNEWWNKIHSGHWDKELKINPYFCLNKHQKKLEDFTPSIRYDIVFYDAFGPHAQPELWQLSIFKHLKKFMKLNALLVTYCAQGQFKRNLKTTGFEVERLPGPPGKREMTRGTFKDL